MVFFREGVLHGCDSVNAGGVKQGDRAVAFPNEKPNLCAPKDDPFRTILSEVI
jgi:hypothetical protein